MNKKEGKSLNSNAKMKKQAIFNQQSFIAVALIILCSVIFMFSENSPSLQPPKINWIYIVTKMPISVVIVYYAWFSQIKPVVFERILVTIVALLPCFSLIIDSCRIILLIQAVLFIILFLVLIKNYLFKKRFSVITIVLTIFLGLLVVIAQDYTFVQDSKGIHFWQIGLILAAIITAVFTILLLANKFKLGKVNAFGKVAIPTFVFAMSFLFIAFTICNLNYVLDTSMPTEYETTIVDKYKNSGYRGHKTYTFTAEVMGEEKNFYVSQSEYNEKEIGDTLSISFFSGAFGHEYYVEDNNTQYTEPSDILDGSFAT